MTAFAAALATLFADPNGTESVTYRPSAGAAMTLRADFRAPAAAQLGFGTDVTVPAYQAEVRVADVTQPREGDVIERADGQRLLVRHYEHDGSKLAWILDLAAQA